MCIPASSRDSVFMGEFGTSAQDCTTMHIADSCSAASVEQQCTNYDPATSERCKEAVAARSCTDFTSNAPFPSDCAAACIP
jgi:hypothetical protein